MNTLSDELQVVFQQNLELAFNLFFLFGIFIMKYSFGCGECKSMIKLKNFKKHLLRQKYLKSVKLTLESKEYHEEK